MAARFVSIDRNTPMLLPPDLREWVPEDDLVHFVIEAVTPRNLLLAGRSRKPGFGGIHGGERGVNSQKTVMLGQATAIPPKP